MNNTIFYLIGYTAAGRLGLANQIAALTGAKVVDSQDIYAPIFNLLESRNPADLPDAAWAQVDAVRAAILTTIETLSPKSWSFVITHAGLDMPADVGVYRSVRDMARRRGAHFQPVTLVTDAPKKLLAFDEPDSLTLDVSDLPSAEAAKEIVVATMGRAR